MVFVCRRAGFAELGFAWFLVTALLVGLLLVVLVVMFVFGCRFVF